jgi:hypothetical protein
MEWKNPLSPHLMQEKVWSMEKMWKSEVMNRFFRGISCRQGNIYRILGRTGGPVVGVSRKQDVKERKANCRCYFVAG